MAASRPSAPRAADALTAIGRADSLSLDPHKWLFAPLDAGCLLVRDPRHLRRAFAHGAAYVDVIADRDMSEFAFWDHGPELSRRFRALKIWFILKCHGARAMTRGDRRQHRRGAGAGGGHRRQRRLRAPGARAAQHRLFPLRARAPARPSATRLNAFNRTLMVDVQRDGEAYLSNAMIGDDFALRACIVNYRTTDG